LIWWSQSWGINFHPNKKKITCQLIVNLFLTKSNLNHDLDSENPSKILSLTKAIPQILICNKPMDNAIPILSHQNNPNLNQSFNKLSKRWNGTDKNKSRFKFFQNLKVRVWNKKRFSNWLKSTNLSILLTKNKKHCTFLSLIFRRVKL